MCTHVCVHVMPTLNVTYRKCCIFGNPIHAQKMRIGTPTHEVDITLRGMMLKDLIKDSSRTESDTENLRPEKQLRETFAIMLLRNNDSESVSGTAATWCTSSISLLA